MTVSARRAGRWPAALLAWWETSARRRTHRGTRGGARKPGAPINSTNNQDRLPRVGLKHQHRAAQGRAGTPTRDIKVLPAAADDEHAGHAARRQRGQAADEGRDGLFVPRHQLLWEAHGSGLLS